MLPPQLESGKIVGPILDHEKLTGAWMKLRRRLQGWQFVASKGDNPCTADVLFGDPDKSQNRIGITAGTSGCAFALCDPGTITSKDTLHFGYYNKTLLLRMLANCANWWDKFIKDEAGALDSSTLDVLAQEANPNKIVITSWRGDSNGDYFVPENWNLLSPGEKAASTQFSICREMLGIIKALLRDVPSSQQIDEFVLTGGLSKSYFFRTVFNTGLRLLAKDTRTINGQQPSLLVSALSEPFSNQTASLGAALTARLPDHGWNDIDEFYPTTRVLFHQGDEIWIRKLEEHGIPS